MTQPSNTPSIPDSEARETVLDALERAKRDNDHAELEELLQLHASALIEVARAASVSELFDFFDGMSYSLQEDLATALAPLLTPEPEE